MIDFRFYTIDDVIDAACCLLCVCVFDVYFFVVVFLLAFCVFCSLRKLSERKSELLQSFLTPIDYLDSKNTDIIIRDVIRNKQ